MSSKRRNLSALVFLLNLSFSVLVLLQRNNELKDNKRTRRIDRLIGRLIPIQTISGRLPTNVNKVKNVHKMK